jgi:hypothetical protein
VRHFKSAQRGWNGGKAFPDKGTHRHAQDNPDGEVSVEEGKFRLLFHGLFLSFSVKEVECPSAEDEIREQVGGE